MTMGELVMLRQARLPTTWGALAFGERGASAVVWKRRSRNDAVNAALSDCRGAQPATSACKVVIGAERGVRRARLLHGRQQLGRPMGCVAPTLDARPPAMRSTECRQQGRRPDACGVRITFCADGSHQQ